MRRGLLSVGCFTVDYTKTIDHLPQLESLAFIESVTRSTGGPGLNMAFDVKQLDPDFPVEAIGPIGADEDGDYIIQRAHALGIVTSEFQRIGQSATGFTDAMTLRENGKRTFFVHIGANDFFDAEKISLEKSNAKILHIGSPGVLKLLDASNAQGESGWVSFLRRARALGFETNMEMVSLESSSMRSLTLPALPYLSTLIINESEAGALCEMEAKVHSIDGPVDWKTLEIMAEKLIKEGVKRLVVIHTPAGAVAVDSSGKRYRQGSVLVPSEEIVGTTGAGDAFAAGVIYALHEEFAVQDALKLGVATAAQNIRNSDTVLGIKRWQQTLDEAEKNGFRQTA